MGNRYFRRGTSKLIWLASAPSASPTQTQLTAGDDLTPDLAEVTGLTSESSPIETPDMNSPFTSTIPGPITAGNPTVTIYERLGDTTFLELLARGATGFLAFCPEGLGVGKPVEVHAVQVSSRSRNLGIGNEGATFVATMAATAPPDTDAVQAA